MKRIILIFSPIPLIFLVLIYFGDKFCTKNKPVSNADILIIEGWLPANYLEEIKSTFDFADYRDVIITGNFYNETPEDIITKTYSTNGPVFIGNGAVLLKEELKDPIINSGNKHEIRIYAKGTDCLGLNAHFTVFINNKILSG